MSEKAPKDSKLQGKSPYLARCSPKLTHLSPALPILVIAYDYWNYYFQNNFLWILSPFTYIGRNVYTTTVTEKLVSLAINGRQLLRSQLIKWSSWLWRQLASLRASGCSRGDCNPIPSASPMMMWVTWASFHPHLKSSCVPPRDVLPTL